MNLPTRQPPSTKEPRTVDDRHFGRQSTDLKACRSHRTRHGARRPPAKAAVRLTRGALSCPLRDATARPVFPASQRRDRTSDAALPGLNGSVPAAGFRDGSVVRGLRHAAGWRPGSGPSADGHRFRAALEFGPLALADERPVGLKQPGHHRATELVRDRHQLPRPAVGRRPRLPRRYPSELRERAVRLVFETAAEQGERHGAVGKVAS